MNFPTYLGANGYNGGDLHIVRNGAIFKLHEFFNNQYNISFNFSIPDTNNNTYTPEGGTSSYAIHGYENISIVQMPPGPSGGQLNQIYIIADVYNSIDHKVSNIKISIAGADNFEYHFYIFIHDNITSAWITPEILTIKPLYPSTYIGLHVRFSDGVVADITNYYGSTWSNVSNSAYIDVNRNAISASTTNIPISTIEGLQISANVPDYLLLLNQTLATTGSVKIDVSAPNLFLASGSDTESSINSRHNIIVFSDGYLSSEENVFIDNVNSIVNEINNNSTTNPYSLLGNDINIWGCFIPSRQSSGWLANECIDISQNGSGNHIFSTVQEFIDQIDIQILNYFSAYFYNISGVVRRFSSQQAGLSLATVAEIRTDFANANNYPDWVDVIDWSLIGNDNDTPGEIIPSDIINSASWLKLSPLVELVGFPDPSDVINISSIYTMMNEKRQHFQDVLNINNIKFPSETHVPNDVILHKIVFYFWQKLANRTVMGIPDTALHSAFALGEKLQHALFGAIALSQDDQEANKIIFNTFVRGLSYNGINLGNTFYDASGNPIVESSGIAKNFDNIIVFHKVPTNKLRGKNETIRLYTVEYDVFNENISFVSLRLNLQLERQRVYIVQNVSFSDYEFIPESFLATDLDVRIINNALHEFSHNSLGDEYFQHSQNLATLTIADQIDVNNRIEPNLQTKYSLNNPQNSDFLGADRIKWDWPRIKCIALAIEPVIPTYTEPDHYYIKVSDVSFIQPNMAFDIGVKVILRARSINKEKFAFFNIVSYISDTHVYELALVNSSQLFNIGDFGIGTMMILPSWISDPDNSNKYESLISGIIKNYINSNVIGQVDPIWHLPEIFRSDDADIFDGNRLEFLNFDSLQYKFMNGRTNILGLYKGGDLYYSDGIYHPSGQCIMKNSLHNGFCFVCKYILIDRYNPLLHPRLDIQYPHSVASLSAARLVTSP